MIQISDRASQTRALAGVRDPRLADLLRRRFASLITADGDLTHWTEFLVLEPGDRESDIIREVGFTPLVEPINGGRFPGRGFVPFWDHLVEEDGYFVLTISFGSTFAYVLIFPDADGTLAELRCLGRRYAS
jgi:hypothetical protein